MHQERWSGSAIHSDVVVAGAGLVGLTAGALFAKRGLSVEIVDQIEDPRVAVPRTTRSIGLTLSARGIRALDELGAGPQLARELVPVHGRCVHAADGSRTLQRYCLLGKGAIYSINRTALLRVLCDVAERAGATIRFNTRCTGIDLLTKEVALIDSMGTALSANFEALICADGARSALREWLSRYHDSHTKVRSLPNTYKEIRVAQGAANVERMDRNAIHVWPCRERLLIALPNVDGSFSASVFLPDGASGFDGIQDVTDARRLFEASFPDFLTMVPNGAQELVANPVGRMLTVEADRWAFPNSLILGDAAHAMPPFYGQGMNCAFEGCQLLLDMWAKHRGDWTELFRMFEEKRRDDVRAIWELSHINHLNLSSGVLEEKYRIQRGIEERLQRCHPERFMPLYAMIAFSTLPYSEARERADRQKVVVDRIQRIADGGWDPTDRYIRELVEALPPLVSSYDFSPSWLSTITEYATV
jgi:kynurenine 3-monooxygenase